MATQNLTAERLRFLFHYDRETGTFTRRIKTTIRTAICEVAGYPAKRGSWDICIDYRRYKAHRLAWLYEFGTWPDGEIDHIDGNPHNNAIRNLRIATSTQNKQNQHRARIDNKSGYLGVHLHCLSKTGEERWRARIQVDKKSVHLGLYETPEAAHAAYIAAKRALHEFCSI